MTHIETKPLPALSKQMIPSKALKLIETLKDAIADQGLLAVMDCIDQALLRSRCDLEEQIPIAFATEEARDKFFQTYRAFVLTRRYFADATSRIYPALSDSYRNPHDPLLL